MKKLYIFILIACSLIIFSSIYTLRTLPFERHELPVKYIIGNITGVDVNGSALTFGEILPGGSATRKILLTNEHNFPISIKFSVSGNLKDSITLPGSIILEPYENASLPVSALAKPGMQFGEYNGTFFVIISRA